MNETNTAVACPVCGGSGVREIDCYEQGRKYPPCLLCRGAKRLTPDEAEAYRKRKSAGARLRAEMLAAGRTKQEEAERLGIDTFRLTMRIKGLPEGEEGEEG